MKKRTKITLAIIIVLLVIGLVTSIICITSNIKNKNTVNVAFYGLEEKDVTLISEQLVTLKNKKGEPYTYNFTTLDSTQALRPQLTKETDVVYTYMGANARQAAAAVNPKKYETVGVSDEVLDGATISVKTKASVNEAGKYSIVPLLMDYYEIDIDRRVMSEVGVKTIVSWNDIENFAVKAEKKMPYSVLIDTGDSSEFLGLIGALTEAFSGQAAYNAAVKEISAVAYPKEGAPVNMTRTDYESALRKLADQKGSPLYEATHLLARWKASGIISQDGFNMNKHDLLNILNIGKAPIVFEPLSLRRQIVFQHTNSISSIYYPAERNPVTRYFTAPVIAAVPLTDKENVKQGIEHLLSNETQGILAQTTGLAPVLANCHIPDHQADDVRYWIAATNNPNTPLGDEIFCEKNGRDLFADVVLSYIKELM